MEEEDKEEEDCLPLPQNGALFIVCLRISSFKLNNIPLYFTCCFVSSSNGEWKFKFFCYCFAILTNTVINLDIHIF